VALLTAEFFAGDTRDIELSTGVRLVSSEQVKEARISAARRSEKRGRSSSRVDPNAPETRRRGSLDFTTFGRSGEEHSALLQKWESWLQNQGLCPTSAAQGGTLSRLITLGCVNPGLLAHYKEDEVEVLFKDTSKGVYPDIVSNDLLNSLSFIRRVRALAISDLSVGRRRSRSPVRDASNAKFERMCDSLRHGFRPS